MRANIVASRLSPFVMIVAAGCVSQGTYEQAVSQTELTKAELVQKNVALDRANVDLGKRGAEIDELKREIESLSVASNESRATSTTRIAELQQRLTELRAAQAAVEARAALYRDISLRLKRQIDAGDVQVVLREGRMVVQLPNDVLFDTGRTELKPAGKTALEAVSAVMNSLPGRRFQVAGHTDDVPIQTARFPSNWELSSARALRVMRFLHEHGVNEAALSAAGYGEFDPVATNGTAEGKRRNRRTEITLQPDIDELVKVP